MYNYEEHWSGVAPNAEDGLVEVMRRELEELNVETTSTERMLIQNLEKEGDAALF